MPPRLFRIAALALAVTAPVVVQAAGDDDEFMNLDLDGDGRGDAKATDPSQWSWPRIVRFDVDRTQLSLRWPGSGFDEVLSFDDIIRYERSRAYEQSPDELFALLADGRRILISRGEDVGTHAVLVESATELPLAELAPGQGHFPVPDLDQTPPQLRIGSAPGVRYSAAATTDLAMRNRRGSGQLVRVAEDDHPAVVREGGGVLEKTEIELVLKQRMTLFMNCYQRELQRDSSLQGTVVVRFVIDRDGSIKHAHLRATSLHNSVVEGCVVDEVEQVRFPRPSGGTVVVSYPFNFQPL